MATGTDGAERETLLLRGSLDMCVLALLSSRPEHAYGVTQRLIELGFPTGYGTVYPLTARLRRQGLLEHGKEERGLGPPRQVLKVTPTGREALSAWESRWRGFAARVDHLLTSEAGHGH